MMTRERIRKKRSNEFLRKSSEFFETMRPRDRFTKKNPSEFPLNSGVTNKKCWSDEEKEALLRALKKYGYTDLNNICKELPDKSKGAVRTMINKLKLTARGTISTRDNCIDNWLRSGLFPGPDTLISQALKYIALFEKQPKPEETAGCDFRALYDLLSKVVSGHPPVNVSRMTHETICYVMAQASHEIWPFYQNEISEYLVNLEEKTMRKCYSRFIPKKSEVKAESSDPLS